MTSGKAIHKSVSTKAHALALANIDQLFENSKHRDTEPDKNSNPNITAVHKYLAPFRCDGEVLEAKLTVKEFKSKQQGSRIYSVEAKKITKPERMWTDADIAKSNRLHAPQTGFTTRNISSSKNNVQKSKRSGTYLQKSLISRATFAGISCSSVRDDSSLAASVATERDVLSHNFLQKSELPSATVKTTRQNDIKHIPMLIKSHQLHGRIDFNGLQISVETGRSRCRQWHNPHDGSQGMSRNIISVIALGNQTATKRQQNLNKKKRHLQ
jgi:hypothetical protein